MSIIRKEEYIFQCANCNYQEMKSILDDVSIKRCCLKGTGATFRLNLKLREFDNGDALNLQIIVLNIPDCDTPY